MQRTRHVFAALGIIVAFATAACVPVTRGAPEANVTGTCYGASWDQTAKDELSHLGVYDDFMERIFPRESGCDPCAYYPSKHDCDAPWPSTAKNLAGLTSTKDQALKDACKMAWLEAWHIASCAIRVVRWMVEDNVRRGEHPLADWALTR